MVGAVIVLVVVAGVVSAVSLAVARRGSRPRSPDHRPAPEPASPPALPRPRTPRPRRPAEPGLSHATARPRTPSRPPSRRDPRPGRRGGGPLTALSAVEKRGRLARLDAVTFVEGPPTAPSTAPTRADAAAGPATRGDQAVVTPEPAVAFEATMPARRRLQAPCQIVRVDELGPGTVIDLVTLGPCEVAGEPVPAGTPLALGFGPVPPGATCQDLEAVMGYWEAIGAIVDLEVVESARATRYRFDCRDDGLALLVQSERA